MFVAINVLWACMLYSRLPRWMAGLVEAEQQLNGRAELIIMLCCARQH